MKITVIVCTYNRCQSLKMALESAAAMRLPELGDWEVLRHVPGRKDPSGRAHTKKQWRLERSIETDECPRSSAHPSAIGIWRSPWAFAPVTNSSCLG